MIELVGVGHICQDHLCLVEAYPPEDGSTRITSIEYQGGGAAATAVAAASRLGIKSALIGTIAADTVGDQTARELENEGVDLSAIERIEDKQGLRSYVMIDTNRGTRTKFPLKDTMPPISWSGHQLQVLANAKALHLDATHYENAMRALELAKSAGVTVSLDGSTRQKDNRLNQELASKVDILITNSEYPRHVTGASRKRDALLELATWGPSVVVSTAGADGVYAVVEGEVLHIPAFPAQVVDTTGAGDVFHGAFLAARLRGKDLYDCIQFAQFAAARKCEQMGGRKGIPDWQTVEQGVTGLERQWVDHN